MTRSLPHSRQTAFTLIELMVALSVFLVICAVAFSLLGISQQRYQSESQVLNSFEEARLAMDEIVRDVNASGYPPANQFSNLPATPVDTYANAPFAWSTGSGYPVTPCQIGTGGGGTCASVAPTGSTPGDFDIIVETNINPQDGSTSRVQWIRYQLLGTTLYRGMVAKSPNDPDADTSAPTSMVPYVQNVMNNASATQIAQFQTYYPTMFPGGTAVPIFSYSCDAVTGTQPSSTVPCTDPLSDHSPKSVRDVGIVLIVMAPSPDPQTGRPLLVQLNGRAHRINPNL